MRATLGGAEGNGAHVCMLLVFTVVACMSHLADTTMCACTMHACKSHLANSAEELLHQLGCMHS